jgi:predicted nucleic acid-binding Zn ribbon protein
MLPHRVCPQCGTENLTDEPVCFACGAPARKRRAPRERPPATPWVLYVGALALLALFAVVVFYTSHGIASYLQLAEVPIVCMLLLALALVLLGQYGFLHARRQDRCYWELKRAPQLPLKQAAPGDAVWLRGTIACDTPMEVPYLPGEQCVYYKLRVREREGEQSGWHTTQRDEQAVDFWLRDGDGTVYLPSGDLGIEAPVCIDSPVDSSTQVRVSALFVGWQVSVCGRVVDDPSRRRLDRLSEDACAVVTCQYAADYLADLSQSERRHRAAGWTLSILALVLLIATCVRG